MQSVNLINQWVEELHKFLDINEELPTYQTKTGKIKTRADVIGVLYGNKNTLTGIIDVVSVNSIYDKNGKIIPGTNVEKLTDLLMNMGLERKNQFQELKENITIYPQEYFSPYDYSNCIHHNTENTICEHLFFVSWMSWNTKLKKAIKHILGPLLGKERMNELRKMRCR